MDNKSDTYGFILIKNTSVEHYSFISFNIYPNYNKMGYGFPRSSCHIPPTFDSLINQIETLLFVTYREVQCSFLLSQSLFKHCVFGGVFFLCGFRD